MKYILRITVTKGKRVVHEIEYEYSSFEEASHELDDYKNLWHKGGNVFEAHIGAEREPENEYATYARDCEQYAEPSMDDPCDY